MKKELPLTPTTRVLAESLLHPAIKIAEDAAAEARENGDLEVAKIFEDRAEELKVESNKVGAPFNEPIKKN